MSRFLRTILTMLSLIAVTIAFAVPTVAAGDASLEDIRQAISEQGATWQARETSVWRLPPEERRQLCGAQPYFPSSEEISQPPVLHPEAATLDHLDWRDYNGHNWTTAIRDQGGCGSCVVFGCTAAFEAALSICFDAPEPRFDLSEQHVFSCGGGSCDWGWNVPSCLNYIRDMGQPDEECYPYRAMDGQPPEPGAPCDESCSDWQIRSRKITSWGWVGSSEAAIKNALMSGPLPVYITVYSDFFAYSSGVYVRTSDHVEGGHIVCMVGWDDDQSCWICKNSWGATWGEDGWFRIRKGTNESDIEASVAWLVPADTRYPSLRFSAYEVVDSLGDGDGVLNPGETARLRVALENEPTWATATNVSGILSTADPGVGIGDALVIYQADIAPGQVVWETEDEFAVSVGADVGVRNIPLAVTISAQSKGLPDYSTVVNFDLAVTYDQRGWPVDLSRAVRTAPVVADLDGDGSKEVVAVEHQGALHIWDRLGQERAGFPVKTSGEVWGSPAVGDLDGDAGLDIVFGSRNDTVYAFTSSAERLFTRDLGSPILSTPALTDLNGDGHLETVVGSLDGRLSILKEDGTDYDRFPASGSGPIFSGPAVADLNGDGVTDVIWGSTDRHVYAISTATGESLTGFPVSVGGMVVSAPSVADVDQDGYNEVAVGCDDGQLYLLDHLGGIQFAVASGHMIRTSPAIADLDSDGYLDIIFGSQNGRIYALDHDGHILSGWPFQAAGFIESSPAIADLNGDGRLDVIFGTAAQELHLVCADGSSLEEYPTPPTGAIYSSAQVDHLDADGDLEIILGTPSGVSVWDYKLPAGVHRPWPMYRGNCRRTGYYGDNAITGVAGAIAGQAVPSEMALLQNYPNPFNAQTQVSFLLPEKGDARLEVYNILGQRVATLAQGLRPAGIHRVAWDGHDHYGSPVASGIYFCRLSYGGRSETRRMVLLR